jgi:hypothetical protein
MYLRARQTHMNRTALFSVTIGLSLLSAAVLIGQRPDDPVARKHPAIQYDTRPTTDPVAELNRRIAGGTAGLTFEPGVGYLRSVLDALHVPVESQMLVYSESSLQSEHITKATPRALYFNDSVAVGWVKGGDVVEVSAVDPQQGVIFYTLKQAPAPKPRFTTSRRCLECHEAAMSHGVPGLVIMSMLPMTDDPNEYAVGWPVDQRTPIEDRWGGWYVTGTTAPGRHLGNVPVYHVKKSGVRATVAPKLTSVKGALDAASYLTPYSDVAALMVFTHQTTVTNLITRMNWVTRVDEYDRKVGKTSAAKTASDEDPVGAAAAELVDDMLFVEEAPLAGRIQGSSGFAEKFSAAGPHDRKGRSLRDLDLDKRLQRYPCSFMIDSPAFDALPARAKNAVYGRLWDVLSGKAQDSKAYARLSPADRQAIIEILRDTKKDLPSSFR